LTSSSVKFLVLPLAAAADAVEELEATAKLYLLVRGQKLRPLGDAQIADIRRRYPIK